MSNSAQLYVKSHVARDLLQNAGLFKSDKLVVWEYVANGLQYVSPGTNPVVKVTLDSKKKRIAVQDNGRGMDWSGLRNFFVMHGENLDRKEGRIGRGMFGTGKSAAFGIAELLRITTVRSGKRSKVELKRSEIEKMKSDDPISVTVLDREVASSATNGTLVEIEGVHLRSLDQAAIIHYIERHLTRWQNTTVFVNNHECEFNEPPVAAEHRFTPEENARELLGEAELVIKVSKTPLDEDLRGVSVYSNGVWHETTMAGSEGREMSQYIFGEIDVSKLDEDTSPIAPFDVSRSMRLNAENEVVRAIHVFVGIRVEEVRRSLLDAERKRKAEQETKKLAYQATEIARVINEDFEAFRQRVAKVRAKTRGASDLNQTSPGAGNEDDDLIFGSELPAQKVPAPTPPSPSELPPDVPPMEEPQPREVKPTVESGTDSPNLGQPAGGAGAKRRPAGGFQVQFREIGEASHRAEYRSDERTIYINLEHPQVAAARGLGPVEDPIFRRLAYEVAFSEYAIALAQEFAKRDQYLDPTDPIFDIRETLNRVARKGASLYAP
jgi:histidine kinase/DNA gyrase B/HSP90-like ATPase